MIVLGSSSARRKEILGHFSIPFVTASPPFDEESIPFQGHPEEFVTMLSSGKAQSLLAEHPESILLCADTVVYHDGKIYGKPKTFEAAFQSLKNLIGKWHTVYTGVTIRKSDHVVHQVESTHVLFNALTDDQIRHYLAHTHWADQAGGYAIQLIGGLIVRKINGCYYNVMGLPVNTVEILLKTVGIELWDYL